MKDLVCLGGDRRMFYTVKSLQELGYKCHTLQVPGFEDDIRFPIRSGVTVLPFPSVKDGQIIGLRQECKEILSSLLPGSVLIGGMLPASFHQALPDGIRLYDAAASEALLCNNAALSAECALGTAILTFPGSIAGSKVLVMGYGRIGSHLTRLLTACGAGVSVYARNQATVAQLRSMGIRAFSELPSSQEWGKFRCIFNTIPHRLIDSNTVTMFRRDCEYYELASTPGALTSDAAALLGERCHLLPGLPGKYAPEQAGIFYAQEVLRILEEIS